MPGNRAPHYPTAARDRHVEGKVLLQFVVDADGRGIPESVQIKEATATEFVEAVLAAFPNLRFYPLDVRGCHLASLAQMPFEFHLSR
jgi:TonB family protein